MLYLDCAGPSTIPVPTAATSGKAFVRTVMGTQPELGTFRTRGTAGMTEIFPREVPRASRESLFTRLDHTGYARFRLRMPDCTLSHLSFWWGSSF